MSAPSLGDLLAPGRCALVTQECQGGIIGPNSALPQLAKEARREALGNISLLLSGARRRGVPVVHCLVNRRQDGVGSNRNAPLFAAARKFGSDLSPGSVGGSLLPELGPVESDLVLTRFHGLGPMHGTDLDPTLRNMGVTAIVGVGVSVNVAIVNFAMDAVNRGYQFVLPRDAVAGYPREYAEAVIDNTLALLTTTVTTAEVLATWGQAGFASVD